MNKEQQKQLITEIMDEDAKDGLYDTVNDTVNELDKLAEKTFKGDDATTFVQREIWKAGYKKAQETLYTEEQVREPIKEMIKFIDDINDNDISEFNYYYDHIMDKLKELLESKKD